MSDVLGFFKIVIIATLFYSFCITGITHSLPNDMINHVDPFSSSDDEISDFQDITNDVQENLNSQTQLPIIEIGALVFYSGNLIVDLLSNFVFAVPQMIGFLISAFSLLFGGVDTVILGLVQSIFSVFVVFLYLMGIIQLLTGLYSGRLV